MMMARKFKILFVIRSCGELGVFLSIIKTLDQRGHDLTVLFDQGLSEKYSLPDMHKSEDGDITGIVYGWARPSNRRGTFVFHSRELLSYRRYLLVEQAWFYGERWRKYLHPLLYKLTAWGFFRFFLRLPPVGLFLRMVEMFTPPNANIVRHLKELSPDVVLVSPINMRFSSADLEYLKAARAMEIPSVLPVLSWDNLTNKGLIHIAPDLFLVWNEQQRKEAMEQHDISAASIRITGAPYFDGWFKEMQPSMDREEFCHRYGLKAEDPILLYFGSSVVGADDESLMVEIIRQTLDAAKDETLRSLQIVVRPHPTNYKIYDRLKDRKNIFFVPQVGEMPDTPERLQLFYNTLYHSDTIMEGANTSAVIEAMILGRPIIAVFNTKRNQEEVQHFRQLLGENVIKFVRTPVDIRTALKEVLEGVDLHKEARERYIVKYLRPRGLSVPAGEIVADEVEAFLAKKHDV